MPFVNVEQNSPDWLKMRAGCATSSCLCDVMAKLKPLKDGVPNPKQAAARLVYLKRKRFETMTGFTSETYVSDYMRQGLENEELARAAYEMACDVEVLHGGLYLHDTIKRFAASPDGRVGADGLIEIKFLSGFTTEANHEDLLSGHDIPEEYKLQMLGQMACSGRQWVDFVSYSPMQSKADRLVIRRFPRDEKRIAEIEAEVLRFLADLDVMVKQARERDLLPVLEQSLAQVSKVTGKSL